MVLMTNWITTHSLFSLSWDEWGSIAAILTAVVLILRWALNRAHTQLFEPTNESIRKLNESIDNQGNQLTNLQTRMEKSDKLFIRHDDQLQDHERRITHLEERK